MSPALLGITTASVWGVHDLVAGVTSRRIGFLATVSGSTLFGFLALTAWLALRGFPDPLHDQAWIAYGSGFGFALATMCLFAALSAGPMSLGVPLAGSYPVSSLMLAAVFGVAPTFPQLVLAAIVIAGVVIVSLADGSPAGAAFPPGWFRRTVLYGLAAHLMFALAIWSGQQAQAVFGTLETTWLARLSGLVLMVVLFAASRQTLRGRMAYLPVTALLGVLDVFAISCMNHAATTTRPEIATVIGSTFGVVTVLLARLFLRERVSPLRWLGIVVTFAAVAALSAVG